jgi:hypothetical protein
MRGHKREGWKGGSSGENRVCVCFILGEMGAYNVVRKLKLKDMYYEAIAAQDAHLRIRIPVYQGSSMHLPLTSSNCSLRILHGQGTGHRAPWVHLLLRTDLKK